MNLENLIIPIGIVAYILIVLGIVSGLRNWKLIYHKAIAFTALGFATIALSMGIKFYIL